MVNCGYRRILLVAVTCFAGCSSGPEAVDMPEYRPEEAAAKAIQRYDADGDGQLSTEEVAECPGLAAARRSVDGDGNGQLSGEEIAARIALYTRRGAGVKSVYCTVTLDGRPFAGATVELVPESFLADVISPARGVSSDDGSVPLSVESEALPADLAGIAAVHVGMYRVRVTHPDQGIPAEYNTETTLGCEVGPTTRQVSFALKSR